MVKLFDQIERKNLLDKETGESLFIFSVEYGRKD